MKHWGKDRRKKRNKTIQLGDKILGVPVFLVKRLEATDLEDCTRGLGRTF